MVRNVMFVLVSSNWNGLERLERFSSNLLNHLSLLDLLKPPQTTSNLLGPPQTCSDLLKPPPQASSSSLLLKPPPQASSSSLLLKPPPQAPQPPRPPRPFQLLETKKQLHVSNPTAYRLS